LTATLAGKALGPHSKARCSRHGLARILAQQPAQSLAADNRSDAHDWIGARDRCSEVNPTMRASLVVMLEPLRENALRMTPADNQKPIYDA
jgi:hypothetical protein